MAELTPAEKTDIAKLVAAEIGPMVAQAVADLHRPKSREEMAKFLGVGLSTFDKHAKHLPTICVGGRRLFDPSKVMEVFAK
ncbi:hypothetical protein EC9_03340 [Rosistilla ulvae]|uniref:Uncharacterized protein n=1 Tax=Rosistilla ulvae TaxID=1930277 RepID=A0A517LU74_9BACT|nr:helix-turn-helix domain-containing protein [Rosistilla ulvae]QDS86175.1 hypothetical protein EC9_03340 [Rosistilla ulvae]